MSAATQGERWLLPEGIEEILPPRAGRLEQLRRELLDLYQTWGYDLVVPPFIEYLDSLLTGTGRDLDLRTFKLTDQLSGRTLGVRADMTPQAARIDAHRLRRETPTRLCYLGTVLHTRPGEMAGTRSPLQVGAELYGHAGAESDLEILALMVETLRCAGIADAHLDLGHVGIFRELALQAGLSAEQESALFDALQRKACPEIEALLAEFDISGAQAGRLAALAELNGADILPQARERLRGGSAAVRAALDNLQRVAELAARRLPEVPLHFDLAELRGYHYHTGVVFAAFVPSVGQEVARGGRYDHIGEVFGWARPAAGFSADLIQLRRLGDAPEQQSDKAAAIFAPAEPDPALESRITALRAQGRRVIRGLPGQTGDAADMGCAERLRSRDGEWVVVAV